MNCDTCRMVAENPKLTGAMDMRCDDCRVRHLLNVPAKYLPSAIRAVCKDAAEVERIRERLFHLAKPADKPTDTRVEG